jgi:hypothetical protein
LNEILSLLPLVNVLALALDWRRKRM